MIYKKKRIQRLSQWMWSLSFYGPVAWPIAILSRNTSSVVQDTPNKHSITSVHEIQALIWTIWYTKVCQPLPDTRRCDWKETKEEADCIAVTSTQMCRATRDKCERILRVPSTKKWMRKSYKTGTVLKTVTNRHLYIWNHSDCFLFFKVSSLPWLPIRGHSLGLSWK